MEVASFLQSGGFRTLPNAGAARPRQTDLYAQGHGVDLLIEVKDHKRKIDVSHIDQLRSRLRRTPSDVVGVIFTTSDLTREALKAIEVDRTREILVVSGAEIELLRDGRANVQPLLERKRNELRVQGRVWLGPVVSAKFLDVQLPRSRIQFRGAGSTQPYFASKTGFAHAAYAMELPDPGWGKLGGDGFLLSLRLAFSTIEGLRDILGCLHEKFGLSNNGSFCIHQSGMCWHGAGAEDLIGAVGVWRKRYADGALKRVHHSEDISYLDKLRDGLVLLSTRQRVDASGRRDSPDSYLHGSELGIQLPGIPLDIHPFLELCRYTGNEWGEFEYVAQRFRRTIRLKKPLKLRVVGTVVETVPDISHQMPQERAVVGVIARNPFFKRRSLPVELRDHGVSLVDLLAMELLLCDITDWHDDGDVVDWYFLKGIETTFVHTQQIVRPFGTWNRIVKRTKNGQALRRTRHSLSSR